MMNLNKILFFGIVLYSNILLGQVGIGTSDPDASSILHLESNNKGFLMTKVGLKSTTDTSTIPNPAVGLLVWNNGNEGLSPQGFFYWNNNQWNSLSVGNGNGGSSQSNWSLSGDNGGNNSGDKTTISIGTATYDDLVFKVNGNIAGRLGVNGMRNIAFGNGSLASGYQSVAIGSDASTSSNDEIALGNSAKTANQSSIAIGSGASATGQYSVAIGHNAKTSQQRALVLGDELANVGIGTNTPNTNTKIDVSGSYKLGTNGSIQKNLISFEVQTGVSFVDIPANGVNYIDFNIPNTSQPSSTRVTVTVSPSNNSNEFNNNFAVVSSRLISTSQVRVYFMNISNAPANVYYMNLYLTLNEF